MALLQGHPPSIPQWVSPLLNCLNEISSAESSAACLDTIRAIIPHVSAPKGGDTQRLIDALDAALGSAKDNPGLFHNLLRALWKICGQSSLLPSSYSLLGRIAKHGKLPAARGGFAHVWKGTYDGGPIALKTLWTNRIDECAVTEEFCKEIVIWKGLSHLHPSIVPFLGVTNTNPPSMVSQWMVHGTMLDYVRSNPGTNRPPLLIDICNGLRFLHFLKIVHGDLKSPNILIDSAGRARLADFGLTSFASDTDPVTHSTITSPRCCGTYRYMAPELLDSQGDAGAMPESGPRTNSDIYALAMVIIELFTGSIPFHELNDSTVIFAVMRGERPPRPEAALALGLSDAVWDLVESCWNQDRNLRPTIFSVLDRLREAWNIDTDNGDSPYVR